jgi:small GTP-binding protein
MTASLDAKIVLLGAASVGKTCIITRATQNEFDGTTQNTIGACYTAKPTEVGSTTVALQIWDTAGQERFRTLAPMYYRGSVVALLVFSLIDEPSLADVRGWAEEMKGQVDEMPALFVVGNKCDLADERRIEAAAAEGLAAALGAVYCEVSAKTGAGVEELFLRVAEEALRRLQGGGNGDAGGQPKVEIGAAPAKAKKKKGGLC